MKLFLHTVALLVVACALFLPTLSSCVSEKADAGAYKPFKPDREISSIPDITTIPDAEREALMSLQLINHLATVLHRISVNPDTLYLEAEYDKISLDNIYLDQVVSKEAVYAITAIMDRISKQRITEENRELLKKWLEEDKIRAIFSTCPDPTGMISADPTAIAFVAGQIAFSWTFHYIAERQKLQREFEKEMWELRKEEIQYLNECQKRLYQTYFNIVEDYGIKDYYRVTEKEIREFLEFSDKSPDETNVYQWLRHKESKYAMYPDYWYRLGYAAEKLGKADEAIRAYRAYNRIHLQFLREDHMAAEVAMNLSRLLLKKGKYDKSELIHLLKTIEENVDPCDDWEYMYFAGTTYMRLDDPREAFRVLGLATTELVNSLDNSYTVFLGKVAEDEDIDFQTEQPPCSYPLAMCRVEQLKAYAKICPDDAKLGEFFIETCSGKRMSAYELLSLCPPNNSKGLPPRLNELMCGICIYPDFFGNFLFDFPVEALSLGTENYEEIKRQGFFRNKLQDALLPCKVAVYEEARKEEIICEQLTSRATKNGKELDVIGIKGEDLKRDTALYMLGLFSATSPVLSRLDFIWTIPWKMLTQNLGVGEQFIEVKGITFYLGDPLYLKAVPRCVPQRDEWVEVKFPYDFSPKKQKQLTKIELRLPLRGMDIALLYVPKNKDEGLFPKKQVFYAPSALRIGTATYPLPASAMSSAEIGRILRQTLLKQTRK